MTTTLSQHVEKRINTAAKYPVRRTAKVTIELLTPLHIGAGDEGEISDAAVVLDANGLATIPGSSIKGVLRSAFERYADSAINVNQVFGYQDGSQGQGSRIRVTWGRAHDQHNKPVEGVLDPQRITTDVVLESAATPELRDHVRIDGRGVSENKFDDLSVAAGHRFTFRIEFVSDNGSDDKKVWSTILGILKNAKKNPGHLRFGGKTRRGFGAVKILSIRTEHNEETDAQFSPRELLEEIALIPDDDCFWMFGGGDDVINKDTESDSNPVRAGKVIWNDDEGEFRDNVLVIPGSSLKGPLRHRTRYHLCRRMGVWAEKATPEDQHRVNVALSLLFGDVDLENKGSAPDRKSPKDRVRAGCLYIDDIYLDGLDGAPAAPDSAAIQNHVTIDRALGGAQDHHLFTDQPLHGGGFTLRIGYEQPQRLKLNKREIELLGINPEQAETEAVNRLADAKAALAEAVEDLKNGLLALGAHGNRGYGWFRAADSTEPAP